VSCPGCGFDAAPEFAFCPKEALDKIQGFTPTEVDRRDGERQFPQLKGQFLVDRDGIVRWANIECATEGLAGIGKFPTDEELVKAARGLPR
jgi:hypothetical protein